MNTDNSKTNPEYLENLFSSSEYLFATAKAQYATSNDLITYFNACNQIGEKIFRLNWTGREFFALKGTCDVAEHQAQRKLLYNLFLSTKQEKECASRMICAQYPILAALRSGELQAYYINHYTGEKNNLKPCFWRSQKSDFTIITGRYKAPERNKRPAIPGIDFIVVLDLKGFKKVIKAMPKRASNKKIPPNKDLIKIATNLIVEACREHRVLVKRDIYADALNQLLETDYFNQNSVRYYWKDDIPDSYKNTKRIKNVLYLSLEQLPKSLPV